MMEDKNTVRNGPTTSRNSSVEQLNNAVVQRRPALGRILAQSGEEKLPEYSRSLFAPDTGTSQEFIQAVRRRASSLIGETIAEQVAEQLKSRSSVLTADHHAPLFHPTPFHGDVMCGMGAKQEGLSVLPVLAFGNVSLSNDFFPRGIIWNGKEIGIFPNSSRHCSVWGMAAADVKQLDPAKFPSEFRPFLSDEINRSAKYSDQITLLNSALWDKTFSTVSGMPKLLYLQAEDIAVSHLHNSFSKGGIISKVIQDKELRDRALEIFKGIPGCWSEGKGTHLFWARDNEGRLVPMQINGDQLIPTPRDGKSAPGTRPIPLNSSAILESLESYTLCPSMFITFGTLIMDNVRCLGGFSQSDYLAKMKDGWVKLLSNAGEDNELRRVSDLVVQGYSTGPIFYLTPELKPGSLDLLLQDPSKEGPRLESSFQKLRLLEANALGMVYVYSSIVPKKEQDPNITKITVAEVAREIGIDK